MAIQDANLLLSNGQALTTVASSSSTNLIDLGAGKDFWGTTNYSHPGQTASMWLNVVVSTTFTGSATTATLQCRLLGGLATTPATVLLSNAAKRVSTANKTLNAGKSVWQIALPRFESNVRYIAVRYIVGTTTFSAGAVDAWISLDAPQAHPLV